jgi:hypothetical protein
MFRLLRTHNSGDDMYYDTYYDYDTHHCPRCMKPTKYEHEMCAECAGMGPAMFYCQRCKMQLEDIHDHDQVYHGSGVAARYIVECGDESWSFSTVEQAKDWARRIGWRETEWQDVLIKPVGVLVEAEAKALVTGSAHAYTNADPVVTQDHIRGFLVSTVWLRGPTRGLSNNNRTGLAIVNTDEFETMIFPEFDQSAKEIYYDRYTTEAAAKAGHIKAIEWLTARLKCGRYTPEFAAEFGVEE